LTCKTCQIIKAILENEEVQTHILRPAVARGKKTVKRKVSAYNKEYKKQYNKLKKKHPRTSFHTLVKKAHTATKKARK
jgi:hypothetical protein